MIKKWLIISMLFTGTVNADIFQALKDAAAKAVEAQNGLKNQSEESMASSDQSSTPQFNSLAEEAAYKKQKEQQERTNSKKDEQALRNNIIARVQNLRASEANFYQKYLVKQNDSQEMIDIKFRNKNKLFQNMQKDFTALDTEREELSDIISRNGLEDVLREYFKEKGWNRLELNTIFTNAPKNHPDGYILECYNLDPYIEVDTYNLFRFYDEYLKCSYLTYQTRQEKAREAKENQIREAKEEQEREIERVKAQKDLEIRTAQEKQNQQIRFANEQKERQKVQGACQAWRTKANKMVYSLGVGDQIMSKNGAVYVIEGVNANTFLITVGRSFSTYVQKSEYIPYLSVKTAPSQYCYR